MRLPFFIPVRGVALFVLAGAVAALFVTAGLREARRPPVVARYVLRVPRAACPARALRLVVAGDLHVSAATPPGAVAAMVGRINALRPDYVLFVGDYLGDGWPTDAAGVRAALAPLAGLRPRVGSAAVLGNNDTLDGIQPIAAALRAAGVRVLWNDAWITPAATVFGIADITTDDANPQQAIDRYHHALDARRLAPPPLAFWLAHQPGMMDRMGDTGTMLFTGHTHGGQVLPAITRPIARGLVRAAQAAGIAGSWPAGHYVRGFYRRGAKRMIVTSGIGTSGLPLRVGVPPEVVLVTVPPCAAG